MVFDFSGQGESTGRLAVSGLHDRAQQALAVVDFLTRCCGSMARRTTCMPG